MPGRAGNADARALAREDQFISALTDQGNLAIRTADELRKIVLLGEGKTDIARFPKGRVDPYLQLLIIARDEYEAAKANDDARSCVAFFREMVELYSSADEKVQKALDMAMRERHHQEKMKALAEKENPTKSVTLADLVERTREPG